MDELDKVIKEAEALHKSMVLVWASVTGLTQLQCEDHDPWAFAILDQLGENSKAIERLTDQVRIANSKIQETLGGSND